MSKMQIFNARTQQTEDAEMSVDANNEIIATFEDGSFIKFPAGLTKKDFEVAITAHEEANKGQEIITPEMEAEKIAARAASLQLIGETETAHEAETDTESDGSTTNATEQPTD